MRSLGATRNGFTISACPRGCRLRRLGVGKYDKILCKSGPNRPSSFLREAQYATRRSDGETECNGVSESPEMASPFRHAPRGCRLRRLGVGKYDKILCKSGPNRPLLHKILSGRNFLLPLHPLCRIGSQLNY